MFLFASHPLGLAPQSTIHGIRKAAGGGSFSPNSVARPTRDAPPEYHPATSGSSPNLVNARGGEASFDAQSACKSFNPGAEEYNDQREAGRLGFTTLPRPTNSANLLLPAAEGRSENQKASDET